MDTFRCGCSRTPTNMYWIYGTARCRHCKNKRARESQARKRAQWLAEYGSATAVPNDQERNSS